MHGLLFSLSLLIANLHLLQGWSVGIGINATAAGRSSGNAPSSDAIVLTVQACFNNDTSYAKVFGPVAASIAQRFNVPAASMFGLVGVQVM